MHLQNINKAVSCLFDKTNKGRILDTIEIRSIVVTSKNNYQILMPLIIYFIVYR